MIYFSTLKTSDEILTADWNFPISRNLKQICLEYFSSLTLFMRFDSDNVFILMFELAIVCLSFS